MLIHSGRIIFFGRNRFLAETTEKNMSRLFAFIVVLIVAVSFMAFSLYGFFERIGAHEKTNVQEQLVDIAKQQTTALRTLVNYNRSVVDSLVQIIPDKAFPQSEFNNETLSRFAQGIGIENIQIVGSNGSFGRSEDGSASHIEEDYFVSALGGMGIVSKVIAAEDEAEIIISAPVLDGEKITGVLLCTYKVKDFAKTLDFTSFDGNGKTAFFEAYGEIIYNEGSDLIIDKGDGLWSLGEIAYDEGYSAEKIYDDIANTREGHVSVRGEQGKNQIAYYTPVGVNDWYALIAVDAADNTKPVTKFAVILALEIVLALSLIFIAAFYYLRKRVKKAVVDNTQTKAGQDRFKIAISQIAGTVFGYDIKTDTLTFESMSYTDYGLPQSINNPSRYMREKGMLSDQDALAFSEMLAEIKKGNPVVSSTLEIMTDNEKCWGKITLTGIHDDEGNTFSAVGTIEDVSEHKRKEIEFMEKQQISEAILSQAVAVYEVNYDNDYFERKFERRRLNLQERGSYSKNLENLAAGICNEDRDAFLNYFSAKSVREHYANGISNLFLEYRMRKSNGEDHWFLASLHLVGGGERGNLKGLLYIKDIDEDKRGEIILKEKAELDPLTRLYNREACREMVSGILAKSDYEKEVHAIMIFDIDDFKSINDTYGHQFGDMVLKAVADKVHSQFRKNDISARLGGDEFIVFLRGISSRGYAIARAQHFVHEIFNSTIATNPPVTIACSLGVALAPDDGTTFEELYNKADTALYNAKRTGKNRFSLYDTTMSLRKENAEDKNAGE